MSLWQNFRDNSGLSDPQWRRFVVRWSLISLLLIAVAAYFSYGFYQFDEHYQVVEFASYKLGRTPQWQLPWEFRLEVRSWLQPGLYYVAARIMGCVGVENPFTLAIGFRAISGLLGWTAITALMFAAGALGGSDQRRRAAVVLLALLWLLPYLAVRTSSESLSSDFLALGVVVLVLGSPAVGSSTRDKRAGGFTPAGAGQRLFPKAALLLAGLSFGLAFEFRFQIALAVIGVLAWVGWNSSEALAADHRQTNAPLLGSCRAGGAGDARRSLGLRPLDLRPLELFRHRHPALPSNAGRQRPLLAILH